MNRPATVEEGLTHGRRWLHGHGSDTPLLDASLLLGHAMRLSRATLLAHPELPMDEDQWLSYASLLARRADGEPMPYLTGEREFYGLHFVIEPSVLVPRPETELLVERAISLLQSRPAGRVRAVDVGVGSGAIAVSIAAHVPDLLVIGVDVSREALAVARRNVIEHGLQRRVRLVNASLLDWLGQPVDLIAANLPYLRPDQAHPSTAHEPAIALYGGADGFDLYRGLLHQVPACLRAGGTLLAEIDPSQRDLATVVVAQVAPGWPALVERDHAGRDRLLVVTRPG